MFHVCNIAVMTLALVMAIYWWRYSASRQSWRLLTLFILLVAINEFGVARVMGSMWETMSAMKSLADDDPLRARFRLWHSISASLHLLTTIIAAWLVALGDSNRRVSACKT